MVSQNCSPAEPGYSLKTLLTTGGIACLTGVVASSIVYLGIYKHAKKQREIEEYEKQQQANREEARISFTFVCKYIEKHQPGLFSNMNKKLHETFEPYYGADLPKGRKPLYKYPAHSSEKQPLDDDLSEEDL